MSRCHQVNRIRRPGSKRAGTPARSAWRWPAGERGLYLSVALCVCFSAAAPASGSNDSLLYAEDFDSGMAVDWWLNDGWAPAPADTGFTLLADGTGHTHCGYSHSTWADSLLRCRLKLEGDLAHVSYRHTGFTRYFVALREESTILHKQVGDGAFVEHLATGSGVPYGVWHTLDIDGQGASISVSLDDVELFSYDDPLALTSGGISFEAFDARVWIDDVQVFGPESEAPVTGLVWQRTGGPPGGLGYDIRMRPDRPDHIYVTDAFAGVFVSTDRGQTWQSANEGINTRVGISGDAIPIFCLTIDPTNPDVIWIGTSGVRGIYRSDDAGSTWERRDNGVVESNSISFRGFAVDPTSPDTVYAAAEISSWGWAGENRMGREFDLTKGVVYKTTDGGENWEAVWRGDNLARYILINPHDTRVLYVSTGIFDREAANSDPVTGYAGGVGVIKSTDGGQSWVEVNAGLNSLYVGSLFMHPVNPDTLLAGTGHVGYSAGAGAYLTTNGAETWEHVLAPEYALIESVEFAQSDPNIAYAAGSESVYRSEDGGHTWHVVAGDEGGWGPLGIRAGFPIDFQVDPDDPDCLFANNYGGGNFMSSDGGVSWVTASKGYTGAQVRAIAVDPHAPGRVFAAARSGIFISPNAGEDWVGRAYAPHASLEWYAVACDPSDPAHVLAANNWENSVLETRDRGTTWHSVSGPPRTNVAWRVIAFAKSLPSVVYAGTAAYYSAGTFDDQMSAAGIFVSNDGGATWAEANDMLSADAGVTALAVDPDDPLIVYAATGNHGLLKTLDGGQSWHTLATGMPGSSCALAVAIQPLHSNAVLAGLCDAGVYSSLDGGNTWQFSGAGLDPHAMVSDIVFDPINPETVFAADRFTGVYRSTDGGAHWRLATTGLGCRDINDLDISSDGKHLYAGTEGGGVYRLDIDGQPPADAAWPEHPSPPDPEPPEDGGDDGDEPDPPGDGEDDGEEPGPPGDEPSDEEEPEPSETDPNDDDGSEDPGGTNDDGGPETPVDGSGEGEEPATPSDAAAGDGATDSPGENAMEGGVAPTGGGSVCGAVAIAGLITCLVLWGVARGKCRRQ